MKDLEQQMREANNLANEIARIDTLLSHGIGYTGKPISNRRRIHLTQVREQLQKKLEKSKSPIQSDQCDQN